MSYWIPSKNKNNRYRYSKYILDKVKGSMCKHGSTHAEQNHSSILARIGDMCYELHVFIYNLMDRKKIGFKVGFRTVCRLKITW